MVKSQRPLFLTLCTINDINGTEESLERSVHRTECGWKSETIREGREETHRGYSGRAITRFSKFVHPTVHSSVHLSIRMSGRPPVRLSVRPVHTRVASSVG